MKKTAIALAMASLAGSAYAQNVTLYGNFDMSFQNTKSTTSGTSTTSTTQLGGTGTQLSTPVLGVRGVEDLGGGLKAGFNAEGAINPSTGQMGNQAGGATVSAGNNTTTGSLSTLFNRQMNVYLEGGFGKVTVGRTADLVDSLEGYANFNQIFDTEAASANGIGGKNGNTTRYDSPTFSGIKLGASYSSNAVGTSSTGATIDDGSAVTTFAVQYSGGPLTVGGAFGRASAGGPAAADILSEGKIDTYFAGYNLGFADVRIQRTINFAAATAVSSDTRTTTNEISAQIPLGNGLTATLHAEKATVSVAANSYTQYGASIQKALSKRTQVYAGYRDKNSSGAAVADTTTFVGGIAHTF